jgi:hypothetical protein
MRRIPTAYSTGFISVGNPTIMLRSYAWFVIARVIHLNATLRNKAKRSEFSDQRLDRQQLVMISVLPNRDLYA